MPQPATMTLVVTNQKLSPMEHTQLGRQVHASLARAIQPFHTPFDGDTLFTATTNEVENADLPSTALGAVASELVERARKNAGMNGKDLD